MTFSTISVIKQLSPQCKSVSRLSPHSRAIAPSRKVAIPASKSLDGLHANYRLHPELGTAAIYKQPGAMRRAHVLESEGYGEASFSAKGARAAYAMTPLVAHLRSIEDPFFGFVSEALHELQDGTVVRFESRHYRRGRAPEIVLLPRGVAPESIEVPLRFWGWKPSSISWWVSICFLLGGGLFTLGSFAWMIPSVGGAAAPAWEAAYTVSYPFFAGSIFFLAGCYLQVAPALDCAMIWMCARACIAASAMAV